MSILAGRLREVRSPIPPTYLRTGTKARKLIRTTRSFPSFSFKLAMQLCNVYHRQSKDKRLINRHAVR